MNPTPEEDSSSTAEEDSSSTPEEHPLVADVRSSVDEKLKNLRPVSIFMESLVCIYKVPDGLRKVNPLSYTPCLVAIGPLHRDNPQLKPMETLKLTFLDEFRRLMNNIDDIINFISYEIQFVSFFYQKENMPTFTDLIEMMLLDSIFIIQIFLKKASNDPRFENYRWFRDLMHDLLLIENQIPLYLVSVIYYNYYLGRQSGGKHKDTNFSDLANSFFKDVKTTSAPLPRLPFVMTMKLGIPYGLAHIMLLEKPRHFVEYLRMAYFPRDHPLQNSPSQPVSSQLDSTPPLQPLTLKKSNKEGNWKSCVTTASRLLECGVKFKVDTSTTTSLMDIQFKDGILTIPPIKVNDWTETLFHNLIAFEHCHHLTPRCVTDYIIFMDSLIDTPKDVNILTNKRIIQDDLQDPGKVSELFNNLYKEVITDNRHFCFAKLSCELKDYRKDWWHQWTATWYNWMVILMRDYFNSPWSIISFIAAVIVLGLTLVQAVCSIYQAKGIKM